MKTVMLSGKQVLFLMLSGKQVLFLIRAQTCVGFFLVVTFCYCLFNYRSLAHDYDHVREENAELRRNIAVYQAFYTTQQRGTLTKDQVRQAIQELQGTGGISQPLGSGKE